MRSSQLVKACLYIGSKLLTSLIAFLQESECLADNFAGCLVQPLLTFSFTSRSSSGVSETFMRINPRIEAGRRNEYCQYLS